MAVLIHIERRDDTYVTVMQFDTIEEAREEMGKQFNEVRRQWIDEEVVSDPEGRIDMDEANLTDGYEVDVRWIATDKPVYTFDF